MTQPNGTTLAAAYRELYREKFRADVEAGATTPFLVPLYLCGAWILPTLYLAIPHKNRPWLYQARWLVLALNTAIHWYMIRNVSSFNFASAYGAGLFACWATVWNFTLLVWTKPQWDAKRVEVRRKRRVEGYPDGKPVTPAMAVNGHTPESTIDRNREDAHEPLEANGHTPKPGTRTSPLDGKANGHATTQSIENMSKELRKRRSDMASSASKKASHGEGAEISEDQKSILLDNLARNKDLPRNQVSDLDLGRLAAEQEVEYYWQEFPEHAPLTTRLDWAFDIVSSFRLTGWNWAIPCLPPYEPPPYVGGHQLPLDSLPNRSKQGFTRTTSRRRLLYQRIVCTILPAYLVIDLVAVLMTEDPYFVVGPEHAGGLALPLPPHLAALPPALLFLRRNLLGFAGVAAALQLAFAAGAVLLALLGPPVLGFRAHPWQLPSMYGSFAAGVLDRGLAGFWGAWWHQTFRFGFGAPVAWAVRRGHLAPRSPAARRAGTAAAFALSGALHAAASATTVPAHTRPAHPALFFALAGVGCAAQGALARAAAPLRRALPRAARRAANLAFVAAWFLATSWLLLDDFGRCGIWLWEPVPLSVVRPLGWLGDTRDTAAWRYDREFFPRWYRGRSWWESGLGV
ncbi:hypothetical protein F4780DRAFT_792054 [Xylariomycetidae sp. FL0641]|nr:hypothetical protein F4780DRAFT_792054 [Xylariomycetidae sp. FL0641]